MSAAPGVRPVHRRAWLTVVVALALLGAGLLTTVTPAAATAAPRVTAAPGTTGGVTGRADDLRDGWYGDEPSLSPQAIGGSSFGELASTQLQGQIYAQPLVSNSVLLVATEADWIYGLDPTTGAVLWKRNVGTPWNPAELSCADINPQVGITSTPVIDPAAAGGDGVAYVMANSVTDEGDSYQLHAVDLRTGDDQPGFPRTILGPAQNAPSTAFDAEYQNQRTGLLLLDGVVYAAYSSHCDRTPWQGWISGVNATTGAQTTMWTAVGAGSNASGAGIWQAGGGLESDGDGQILFATGNGGSPTAPAPGDQPPTDLGESVVRAQVGTDGNLTPTDFFSPYDNAVLDAHDFDFGSGAPVALPSQFGTAAHPDLLVAVGKQGYVYLLDRDDLGGFDQGPGGGDADLDRVGPGGGVWSSPTAWPGDGGYVYVPTATGSPSAGGTSGELQAYRHGVGGTGLPTLTLAGTAPGFGFGSGSPVVTSDGTTSGTATLWDIWMASGNGAGAQLRAYAPLPGNGAMSLLRSFPIGTGTKFSTPGVAGGKLYVGTADGTVEIFGSPVPQPVTAPSTSFPTTVVGATTQATVTYTATRATTIGAITVTGAPFTLDAASAVPQGGIALGDGQSASFTVDFSPTAAGPVGGTITATTADGSASTASLTGAAEADGPVLDESTNSFSAGGTTVGNPVTGSVIFSDVGNQDLTFSAPTMPASPFSLSGTAPTGSTLEPGQSITVNVTFTPPSNGVYNGQFAINSNGGDQTVVVSGQAGTPPVFSLSTTKLAFGSVPVGSSVTKSFTITNKGGVPLILTLSKPPIDGPFTAQTSLPEGTTIGPGKSATEWVTFQPGMLGAETDQWLLSSNASFSRPTVSFTGTGTGHFGLLPAPYGGGGWQLLGSAQPSAGTDLALTPAAANQRGAAWFPVAQPSAAGITASFLAGASGGTGGVGEALVLGDVSRGASTSSLGAGATGEGFVGIPGIAVAFDDKAHWVGISDDTLTSAGTPHWLATAPVTGPAHQIDVMVTAGHVTVLVDGVERLSLALAVPARALIGFTGATGTLTNQQTVSGVRITVG